MTAKEFNEKYKPYIPEGWYGLGFDIPEVTDYLDKDYKAPSFNVKIQKEEN